MIIQRNMYYPPAGADRRLHIWLPDNYYDTDERYPVMYFFDGHNLFYDSDATYGKCWGLREFMDHWDKPVMIVGMECSHEGNERLSEYCPYYKRMHGEEIHGIGDDTMQWIIHDIKPMIDREYRTYGHREATGIGGSSMGGLMSIFAVIKYNNVFSKAACLSTGIFYNIADLRKNLADGPLNPDTRIYLSWGEFEAGRAPRNGNPEFDTREARSVRKFERELQAHNAMTYLYFQREGRHCEADWEKQNPVYMNWLWKQ